MSGGGEREKVQSSLKNTIPIFLTVWANIACDHRFQVVEKNITKSTLTKDLKHSGYLSSSFISSGVIKFAWITI